MTKLIPLALLLSLSQAHAYSMTANPCVDIRAASSDYCTQQRIKAELEAMRRRIEQQSKEK